MKDVQFITVDRDVKFNPETDVNITPDDDGIDRSNPTAKIN